MIIASLSTNAQSPILSEFVQKVKAIEKLSCVSLTNNESPFGDNADTITVYIRTKYDITYQSYIKAKSADFGN